MKIIHLLANNIKIWAEYLDGTEYYVNAYTNIEDLETSIVNFNARDVLGFILYPSNISTSFLEFLDRIDKKFVTKITVILVTHQNDKGLQYISGRYKLLNIYNIISEDNSISDVDINNAIILLLASNDAIYPLYDAKPKRISLRPKELPEEAKFVIELLRKGDLNEIREAAKRK